MYDPQNPTHTTMYAQALYAKLQKLSEDIALQHSIINAQKETVLKSRQRIYVDNPKPTEPQAIDQTHTVYAHADTVVQHRAMIIKHYELIQQHKQMVKEQGKHVQNLTSTLLNIQQETTVVDELMNTKMAETRSRNSPTTPHHSSPSSFSSFPKSYTNDKPTPHIPSSPDISIKARNELGNNKRKATFQQSTQNTTTLLNSLNKDEEEEKEEQPQQQAEEKKEDTVITTSPIITTTTPTTTPSSIITDNTIHVSIVSEEDTKDDPHITSITVTTTSTSSSSTPTSKSLSTTTVSSVSTSTLTTTTATTTTTTTFSPSSTSSSVSSSSCSSSSSTPSCSPSILPEEINEPLPLSP